MDLNDMRGRVPAREVRKLQGTFFVYWGNASTGKPHRIATIHRRKDNGTPACTHVTTAADVVVFPEGMDPEIRWYKACRDCQTS